MTTPRRAPTPISQPEERILLREFARRDRFGQPTSLSLEFVESRKAIDGTHCLQIVSVGHGNRPHVTTLDRVAVLVLREAISEYLGEASK